MLACTLALYGAGNASESTWMIVLALSRMITPTSAMPSPVAFTDTESEYSLRGPTVCVTRGCAALADRTKTTTGDDDPGWRSTSTAEAVIVTRPRIGALSGMRATAEKVTSRGLLVYTCVKVVSNLVGQLDSPWTRMSMRPTPSGCVARAETFRPTPAGMLSPLVGDEIDTRGPATMLMRVCAVSAAPMLSVTMATTIRLSSDVS